MLRRSFLGAPLLAAAADAVPRVDYHAHPEHGMTVEKALAISRQRNVKLGLVEHAGAKESPTSHRLSTDGELRRWIRSLQGKPVYCGIQAEGMDWHRHFSKAAVAELDYVLGDALTMPYAGKMVKLWTADFHTSNPQDFMDRYVDYHIEVMAKQPLDILANPTFLPAALQPDAARLWTEPRMRRIVEAAKQYGIAIEINTKYNVPAMPFLQMAKDAGLQFSFGSNAHTADAIGDIAWCLEVWKKLGLSASRFFRPAPAGKKPIQLRTLA
jgi:histidinol phosphatase-like PHP family hydrolase